MTYNNDNTPILVGVGQLTQARTEHKHEWLSHADLGAQAAKLALDDALPNNALASHVDAVIGVKTFADSSPMHACPFGVPNNLPRAVSNRLGFTPKYAAYEVLGGQAPQKLVGEFSERLAAGEFEAVLIFGSEVIANIKSATRADEALDWTEQIGGQLEDRGLTGGHPLITRLEFEHKLMAPIQFYGLMENARRARLKQSIKDYSQQMGTEFAAFSEIAASNPHAVDQRQYTVDELSEVSDKNPMIVHPYTKRLVAKDNVNQAAAVVLTTVAKASELNIDKSKWVYLHGYCDTRETVILERNDLSHSEAMKQSLLAAVEFSKITPSQIKHFDLYSCFPIVVSNAREILGIEENDKRQLTQTGGLPYFGGPGNNYSMHGIASLVETLRKDPESYGLVYANGGVMTKHSTGIYSTHPPAQPWKACDSSSVQSLLDISPTKEIDYKPEGEAILETYTAIYMQGYVMGAAIIGSMRESGKRFFALTDAQDENTLNHLMQNDALGSSIFVRYNPRGNQFAFTAQHLDKITPAKIDTFKQDYKYCSVEKNGSTLIVTINRPEVRNALNPQANEELEGIFNAYENDAELWVAILTSAEDKSFSTGNDLKHMAAGGDLWVPKTGFAGLTNRPNRIKPIIAAVNGAALGGGLEIAMACDIIIAADHAVFGLPEVKVGLVAMMGGVQRLTQSIGHKPATQMMLTGESIDCEKALTLGLINEAVPYAQLMPAALEMASKITSASPTSVSCTMELQRESSKFTDIEESISAHYNAFDRLLNSEDFFEGPKAFAEKRAPKWTGK